ncbi:uncharacterized protein LOC108150174 [Drosophila elegans]|uniref:uncharacterized protein LOC108150174 n=1 Tax=Drosophila elegans TaxID=30023 RepID=UPI0007E5F5BA|nr:uncharacterized protein LOC108150174 [Drosophila elegans]
MKSLVLFLVFSVVLVVISCANAEDYSFTEAAPTTTESPSVPQRSWTDFTKFLRSSSTGNKFYFFF